MSSQYGPQYFPNLSNAIIKNPIITHVSGNTERQGLTLLLDNISKGAFHDAAERGDPPKCYPHTRLAIRKEIMEWIKVQDAKRKLIIWMYGPAGSGKTAIGQSIAEECKKQGLLAASFFFSRTAPGRNDTRQIEDHLLATIEQDPTIFSRSLMTQMDVLVVEPLKLLFVPMGRPIFVILDGVDEIGPNPQSQSDLLNSVELAISALRHIPLIFLIASRPEYQIRETFNGSLLSSLTKSLALDDKYMPDKDIRFYFESTFQEIHKKHRRLGSRLPSSWPSNRVVDLLVSKASGQFIYAATVLKFIDSPQHDPTERLKIILSLSFPANETPFALLDALYRHILSSVANLENVLDILTVIMLSAKETITLNVPEIEELLGINLPRALIDMHSLVFVPARSRRAPLRIHHASLYDFFMDPSRSNDYYIGAERSHLTLSRHWLKVASKCRKPRKPVFQKAWSACLYHYDKSPACSEIAHNLACFDLRQYLASLDVEEFYKTPWQACSRIDEYPCLRNELDAFILERLSRYPPSLRTHIPTLLVHSGRIGLENIGDICKTLLWGVNHWRFRTEWDEILELDSQLLHILDIPLLNSWSFEKILGTLFEDPSQAGQYFAHDGNYLVALATKMIEVIYFQHIEDYQSTLKRFPAGDANFPYMQLITTILPRASTDLALARLLREHVLQYHMENARPLAIVSLQYIERCGLPFWKHAHLPRTEKCILCEKCEWASVVNSDQVDVQGPSLVSPLPTSESALPSDEIDDLPNELYESRTTVPSHKPEISVQSFHEFWNPVQSSALSPTLEALKIKRKRGVQNSPEEHPRTRLKMGPKSLSD